MRRIFEFKSFAELTPEQQKRVLSMTELAEKSKDQLLILLRGNKIYGVLNAIAGKGKESIHVTNIDALPSKELLKQRGITVAEALIREFARQKGIRNVRKISYTNLSPSAKRRTRRTLKGIKLREINVVEIIKRRRRR
tara:strand:- start:6582 stop:6995 length:414 start_codon:yes stop_codon:yes gene_type:complete